MSFFARQANGCCEWFHREKLHKLAATSEFSNFVNLAF